MYEPEASITTELPDKQCIPHKDKRKNNLYTSIKEKKIIQEPDNPSKRAKEDSIPYEVKHRNNKHLHHLKKYMTTLMILVRRPVNPMILQVKLMVV